MLRSSHLTRANAVLLVLLVLLVGLTIAAWKNPKIASAFDLSDWIGAFSLITLSYWEACTIIIFLCFIGALIPFPVPYIVPIIIYAYQLSITIQYAWMPLIGMIFLATLSNTVGDFLDYLMGRGAELFTEKNNPELQTRWAKIILARPRAIPFVIFLFGLTPLPESMLMVPLGFVRYSMKKTIIAMYLGKFGMILLAALAGIYGIEPLLNYYATGSAWWGGILILYGIWVILALMINFKPKQ